MLSFLVKSHCSSSQNLETSSLFFWSSFGSFSTKCWSYGFLLDMFSVFRKNKGRATTHRWGCIHHAMSRGLKDYWFLGRAGAGSQQLYSIICSIMMKKHVTNIRHIIHSWFFIILNEINIYIYLHIHRYIYHRNLSFTMFFTPKIATDPTRAPAAARLACCSSWVAGHRRSSRTSAN